MHAISGWQAFFPMHFQAFHPAVAPPQRSETSGPGPRHRPLSDVRRHRGLLHNSDSRRPEHAGSVPRPGGGADGEPDVGTAVPALSPACTCCERCGASVLQRLIAHMQRGSARTYTTAGLPECAREPRPARSWPCCSSSRSRAQHQTPCAPRNLTQGGALPAPQPLLSHLPDSQEAGRSPRTPGGPSLAWVSPRSEQAWKRYPWSHLFRPKFRLPGP